MRKLHSEPTKNAALVVESMACGCRVFGLQVQGVRTQVALGASGAQSCLQNAETWCEESRC